MRTETEMFFQCHRAAKTAACWTFSTANYTFLNEPLAKHYGIAGRDRRQIPRASR